MCGPRTRTTVGAAWPWQESQTNRQNENPTCSMKILIVDDYANNRRALRAVLEAEGLDVVEAADGVEALAVLKRENVDAVISDILMPRMDGYRLCLELRQSAELCRIPFIVYTSTYTSQTDEHTA